MKNLTTILTITLIILAGTITYLSFQNQGFTGLATTEEVLDNYTYTKAICNETNFCQDYEIVCDGNETLSVNPITGAFVQHFDNWEDPRGKEVAEDLCN